MSCRRRILKIVVGGIVFLVAVLGGCGSRKAVREPVGIDNELVRSNRSARAAFEQGKLKQSAGLYRRALERAYLRDDTQAIVDALYNLAAVLAEQDLLDDAYRHVRQAREESDRAGLPDAGDIRLLEATILYRLERSEDAWQILDGIVSAPSETPMEIQHRAWFLKGVIADEQGDVNQLRQAILAIEEDQLTGELLADREELDGRLAMADRNWPVAIDAFDRAARLRREALAYRQMAELQAMAARGCEAAGDMPQAARRYLRAGRSAAQRGDAQNANSWLGQAESLARKAGDDWVAGEARRYLRQLD